jgi:hypothetical protein
MRVLPFDHPFDALDGGVEGLAQRALAVLDADPAAEAPALVCGESLVERLPSRLRMIIQHECPA